VMKRIEMFTASGLTLGDDKIDQIVAYVLILDSKMSQIWTSSPPPSIYTCSYKLVGSFRVPKSPSRLMNHKN
jgi:hypothetical protein